MYAFSIFEFIKRQYYVIRTKIALFLVKGPDENTAKS